MIKALTYLGKGKLIEGGIGVTLFCLAHLDTGGDEEDYFTDFLTNVFNDED
ncbi:MAG: hypothetical protein ACYDEX_02590 [Mobilitalea sp.]